MTHIQTTPQTMKGEGIALQQIQQTEPVSGPKTAFRYGAAMPLAAIATVGLMISMAALIATEFTPQDKVETASFEINPRVDDIPNPIRTIRLDPLREVEVPPPPPTTGYVQTAAVDLPIVEVTGKKVEFDTDALDMGDLLKTVHIQRELAPINRFPPVFPARFLQGNVSGYCKVRFDLGPDGKPFNVRTTICTDKGLKSATVKSVKKWIYAPQVENGRPVSRSGLETTIRFDLQGDRGELLPLPTGF
jgi:protein TonB